MENYFILMEIFMKVIGKMICSIQMENMYAKMDIFMRDNGIREKNKVKEFNLGQMDKVTLAILKMD